MSKSKQYPAPQVTISGCTVTAGVNERTAAAVAALAAAAEVNARAIEAAAKALGTVGSMQTGIGINYGK